MVHSKGIGSNEKESNSERQNSRRTSLRPAISRNDRIRIRPSPGDNNHHCACDSKHSKGNNIHTAHTNGTVHLRSRSLERNSRIEARQEEQKYVNIYGYEHYDSYEVVDKPSSKRPKDIIGEDLSLSLPKKDKNIQSKTKPNQKQTKQKHIIKITKTTKEAEAEPTLRFEDEPSDGLDVSHPSQATSVIGLISGKSQLSAKGQKRTHVVLGVLLVATVLCSLGLFLADYLKGTRVTKAAPTQLRIQDNVNSVYNNLYGSEGENHSSRDNLDDNANQNVVMVMGNNNPSTIAPIVATLTSLGVVPSNAYEGYYNPDKLYHSGDVDDNGSPITYQPGNLTRFEHGLWLSEGLSCRIVARSGRTVQYDAPTRTQLRSNTRFHTNPDAGATFVDTTREDNAGGWIYVSNSEVDNGRGGVGAVVFDANGRTLRYEIIVRGTTMNCGGGKTPWDTWISCEETDGGQIYQVDPNFGGHSHHHHQRGVQLTTLGGRFGGKFESFAYDVRDMSKPRFYVTEDSEKGALRRFTPHHDTIDWIHKPWDMLHGDGTLEYLFLQPTTKNGDRGTYRWTTDFIAARKNAKRYYPNSEGITVYDGQLFFICKNIKTLFVLNLDSTNSYQSYSTKHGLFDGQPDQIQRIIHSQSALPDDNQLQSTSTSTPIMYFTEEGGQNAGVHGRNANGQYLTILESPVHSDETTGLAFSPNSKHMYVAYQKTGLLFDCTRQDGRPFYGKMLDVKYHHNDASK